MRNRAHEENIFFFFLNKDSYKVRRRGQLVAIHTAGEREAGLVGWLVGSAPQSDIGVS